MLPTCTLRRIRRGGRRLSTSDLTGAVDDLQAWIRGEFEGLWKAAAPRKATGRPAVKEAGQKGRNDRATSLAREGCLSQAISALDAPPPAERTEKVLEQMRTLHPRASGPPSATAGQEVQIAEVELLACLRSFHRGSSGGPSGLAPQHLKDVVERGEVPGLVASITEVVRILANGRAPREVAPLLAGANLTALEKEGKPGEHRPVAVGETWRRLVAKILCGAYRSQARSSLLEVRQLGVAVSGGVEAAVHTLHEFRAEHALSSQKVFVKIDFSNAFNCVKRGAFLDSTRDTLLESWVSWCYGAPTWLLFGDERLSSEEGAQQGDPLGPLLFSLAIKPALQKVLEAKPELACFYLDDGLVAGTLEQVDKALQILQKETAELGLTLRPDKCQTHVLDSAQNTLPLGWGLEGMRPPLYNGDFLGAPFGTEEHCQEFVDRKVAQLEKKAELLADLQDRQVAMVLLRQCMGFCKVTHLMRCCTHGKMDTSMRKVDELMRSTASRVLGLTLEGPKWMQAQLPTRMGGLGLRSCAEHRGAALLGSLELVQGVSKSLWEGFKGVLMPALKKGLNLALPEELRIEEDGPGPNPQRLSSAKLDQVKRDCLLGGANDPRDKGRLLSLRMDKASAWLQQADEECAMDPETFRIACGMRLGAALFAEGAVCRICSGPQDRQGYHASICIKNGHVHQRHERVKEEFISIFKQAGLPLLREPSHLLGPNKQRPGDWYCQEGLREGRGRAFDITVVNPGKIKLYKTPGQAAREAESLKGNKYAEQCTKHGINFSTIALEAYGGMGREAVGTLKKLVQICATNSTVPHREIAGEMARRISTSVVVATAEALRAREASVAMDSVNPLPRTKPPPEMTEKPTSQEREPRPRAETEEIQQPEVMRQSAGPPPTMRGLPNIGNSCYLNASVQCLLKGTALTQVLTGKEEVGMSGLLSGVVKGSGECLEKLSEMFDPLQDRRQGEVVGTLTSIVDALLEEKKEVCEPLFSAVQLKQLVCTGCADASGSTDELTLIPLCGRTPQVRLQPTKERVERSCEKLCGSNEATLEESFASLPSSLIFQREKQDTQGSLGWEERFQVQVGERVMTYQQTGAIAHLGSDNAGHYVSYTWDGVGWQKQDDKAISQVSTEEIHGTKPVVVVYSRVEGSTQEDVGVPVRWIPVANKDRMEVREAPPSEEDTAGYTSREEAECVLRTRVVGGQTQRKLLLLVSSVWNAEMEKLGAAACLIHMGTLDRRFTWSGCLPTWDEATAEYVAALLGLNAIRERSQLLGGETQIEVVTPQQGWGAEQQEALKLVALPSVIEHQVTESSRGVENLALWEAESAAWDEPVELSEDGLDYLVIELEMNLGLSQLRGKAAEPDESQSLPGGSTASGEDRPRAEAPAQVEAQTTEAQGAEAVGLRDEPAQEVGQPEEKEPPSPDPPSKEEKLYAVAVGWKPGVYASWEEAKAQTEGCPNATHQSFSSRKEADRFVERWQPETREPTRATEGVSPRKWYAVARGRAVGLFQCWNEANSMVSGYAAARHKSFASKGEAEGYLRTHLLGEVVGEVGTRYTLVYACEEDPVTGRLGAAASWLDTHRFEVLGTWSAGLPAGNTHWGRYFAALVGLVAAKACGGLVPAEASLLLRGSTTHWSTDQREVLEEAELMGRRTTLVEMPERMRTHATEEAEKAAKEGSTSMTEAVMKVFTEGAKNCLGHGTQTGPFTVRWEGRQLRLVQYVEETSEDVVQVAESDTEEEGSSDSQMTMTVDEQEWEEGAAPEGNAGQMAWMLGLHPEGGNAETRREGQSEPLSKLVNSGETKPMAERSSLGAKMGPRAVGSDGSGEDAERSPGTVSTPSTRGRTKYRKGMEEEREECVSPKTNTGRGRTRGRKAKTGAKGAGKEDPSPQVLQAEMGESTPSSGERQARRRYRKGEERERIEVLSPDPSRKAKRKRRKQKEPEPVEGTTREQAPRSYNRKPTLRRVGKGDSPDTMGYAHGPPGSLTSFTDAGVRPEPAERDGQGVAGVELVTRSSSQSEKSTQGEMREREGDPTRRVLDFSSKGGRR